MSWKGDGFEWTESIITGVIPAELKRLFRALRAPSSPGPLEAKVLFEVMIQIGDV